MDYRIFNVRTDVNACGCTRGCRHSRKGACTDSWLGGGGGIPCRTGESNLCQRRAGPTLYYNWATSKHNPFPQLLGSSQQSRPTYPALQSGPWFVTYIHCHFFLVVEASLSTYPKEKTSPPRPHLIPLPLRSPPPKKINSLKPVHDFSECACVKCQYTRTYAYMRARAGTHTHTCTIKK